MVHPSTKILLFLLHENPHWQPKKLQQVIASSFHFLQEIPPRALHLSTHCLPFKVRLANGFGTTLVGAGAAAVLVATAVLVPVLVPVDAPGVVVVVAVPVVVPVVVPGVVDGLLKNTAGKLAGMNGLGVTVLGR